MGYFVPLPWRLMPLRIIFLISIVIYPGLVVSSSQNAFTADECAFPALFAFGDSLTDTGNGQAVFSWQHAPTRHPYGITYFGKPVNRFSDGRLIIDLLAQALRLPLLDPYLRNVGMNFQHGVNFATSGATVTNITFLVPFNFEAQTKWFERFQRSIVEQPKNFDWFNQSLPQASQLPNALYMICIGGNDYDAAIFWHNETVSQMMALTPSVVSETLENVRYLYNLGVQYFLIFNLPPISCTPEFLTFVPPRNASDLDAYGCYTIFNNVFENHNDQLFTGIQTLRNELESAKIVYVDYYAAILDIASNHTKYGFYNLSRACCGVGGQYNYDRLAGCGDPGYIAPNGQHVVATVCSDPNVYTNWDGIHPTEAVHKWIVRFIFNGSHIDPPDALASCNPDFTRF